MQLAISWYLLGIFSPLRRGMAQFQHSYSSSMADRRRDRRCIGSCVCGIVRTISVSGLPVARPLVNRDEAGSSKNAWSCDVWTYSNCDALSLLSGIALHLRVRHCHDAVVVVVQLVPSIGHKRVWSVIGPREPPAVAGGVNVEGLRYHGLSEPFL